MPIGEAVGEVVGGALRVVGRIFVEVVVEILIRGAGYLIIQLFKPRSEPDEDACAIVGVVFWVLVALLAWFLYRQTAGS